MIGDAKPLGSEALLRDRIAILEAELAASQSRADQLLAERDRLREAYRHLELQVELQRRRLFVAKAERIDTAQLELEFAATLAKLNEIAGQLPADGPGTAWFARRHRETQESEAQADRAA